MARLWSAAASAAAFCWWLGAGLVAADVPTMTDMKAFNNLVDAHAGYPHQSFKSSPIVAPVFQVNSWDHNLTDNSEYIFLGSVYGEMNGGPMIFDAKDLSLVYADQQYENAYTSEVQTMNGTRYLTFWEGFHSRGHANGFCLLVDENYHVKYNVSAVGLHGALADMHELYVTGDSSVIFTTYRNIQWDCTPVNGPRDGLLIESGFQEVDVETNELLFDWSATNFFDVNHTFATYGPAFGVGENTGFDFFHINSVEKTEDGNYLISSRHLCLLALIDGNNGNPIWILGGRRNQFKDLSGGSATDFCWQHDARFYQNQSHITMFDNHRQQTGYCGKAPCHSRGLHLEIDTDEMTARVVNEFFHPQKINAGAMGGFQALDNGNVMTAWGHAPTFVEFTSDGTPAMDIQRGRIAPVSQNDMFAYRVHKGNWTGRPPWPVGVGMDAPSGTTENATIYMSWNGATDVDSWGIFASDNPRQINGYENYIGLVDKSGFETSVYLGPNTTANFVAVAAIDANGDVLGSSLTWDMHTKRPVVMESHIHSIQPPSAPKETATNGFVIGGGLVVFAGIFYTILFFWRRKRRAHDDIEGPRYKPVAVND